MPITHMRGLLMAAVVLGGMGAAATTPHAVRSVDRGTEVRASADTFPTFDRVLLLEPTSETSANVSIGDVNADGRLDIVLAKGRHWPLVDRVLLGDGAGHFS